jgi:hypothetical protein
LLASEERVTFGANLQTDLASLGGTSLESLATGTDNIHFDVFGMNLLFHERVLDGDTPNPVLKNKRL